MRIASTDDFRVAAARRLPSALSEYIEGGAISELTLKRNLQDLADISLRQRVMVDTTAINTNVQLMGATWSLPIGLAPVGLAGMYRRRGEAQAMRAAAAAGVPFCLSTMGICSVEEVVATGAAPWFQLYVTKDRAYMKELLARVRQSPVDVLVLTVDLPTPGSRYRDVRSRFSGSLSTFDRALRALEAMRHPQWIWDVGLRGQPHSLGSVQSAQGSAARTADLLGWIGANFDRSVTWKDLDWIREHWDRAIVVKGVLDVEDARAAVAAGAQGLIVSNHGGRQLDSVRSSISALPAVVEAVGDATEVYMDGGVRSGLDVLKSIALGAKACFIGRPWAWALATHGQRGVGRLLEIMRTELEAAMVLTGCTDLADAGEHLLDRGARLDRRVA